MYAIRSYYGDADSTYIQEPPFFKDFPLDVDGLADIKGAKALALLGDSITTDHISPAGSIPSSYPAGEYLIAKGVDEKNFNSYGSMRGNHEVMMRGTFGNVRLKNKLAGKEGSWTVITSYSIHYTKLYDIFSSTFPDSILAKSSN